MPDVHLTGSGFEERVIVFYLQFTTLMMHLCCPLSPFLTPYVLKEEILIGKSMLSAVEGLL